jgi:hypothetical protein
MFDRMKGGLKTVSIQIKDAQDQIAVQADDILVSARHKVHLVRTEGAGRIWQLETQALDWVDDVLERADVYGVEKVREPVQRIVSQARSTVTANPIEGYKALNARGAAAAVRSLGSVDLLRVERIEKDGKDRKTVAEAIERRRVEIQRPPFREDAAA